MAAGTTPSGKGLTDPVKIVANIFISFIGAGVLGLPYAFEEAGILEGVVIMASVGFFSVQSMLLIIDCKDHLISKRGKLGKLRHDTSPPAGLRDENKDHLLITDEIYIEDTTKSPGDDLSYGDVAYYAMGTTGRTMVEIAILVSQIGFCCAYLIFISENLSAHLPNMRTEHWLCILLPPLCLLTLFRHLSSLSLSSLFAQISNILAFAVVFWFDFEHFHIDDLNPKEISIVGMPFFLAVSIYCYEGAGMILSLEMSLNKTVRHKFRYYFKMTLIFVTILYILFGTCGYLSYGPFTNPVITLNLPKGSSLDFAIIVKACLCLSLFFTYPVMMFPVVSIMERKLIENYEYSFWKGNFLRLICVLLTGVVVMAVPDFANLMALVGATCCTMLNFLLPGLFHYLLHKGTLTTRQILFDVFLIVLGVVGALVGTYDALVRMNLDASIEHDIKSLVSNASLLSTNGMVH